MFGVAFSLESKPRMFQKYENICSRQYSYYIYSTFLCIYLFFSDHKIRIYKDNRHISYVNSIDVIPLIAWRGRQLFCGGALRFNFAILKAHLTVPLAIDVGLIDDANKSVLTACTGVKWTHIFFKKRSDTEKSKSHARAREKRQRKRERHCWNKHYTL